MANFDLNNPSIVHICIYNKIIISLQLQQQIYGWFRLVLESPVTRPQKDQDRTGLRPRTAGLSLSISKMKDRKKTGLFG
jgi:hypothetical protein